MSSHRIAAALALFFLSLPGRGGAEVAPAPYTTRSPAADRVAARPVYVEPQERFEFGVESRTRCERRRYDYTTQDLLVDDALVTRNLLYVDWRPRSERFGLVAEIDDSRRFFSEREVNPNIENDLEPIQVYGQVRFDDFAGGERLTLAVGRMTFDWVDRRLFARNRNRNTINSFQGIRLNLGEEHSPWEVEAIALRPVERSVDSFDEASDSVLIAGLAGYLRGHSPHFLLEPYWLCFDEDTSVPADERRSYHHFGLHAYGLIGDDTGWDYDFGLITQSGSKGGRSHLAWAAHAELGHTWETSWRPRLSGWMNYASGDRDPDNQRSGRFDPLFGATYTFYGFGSFFSLENLVNPALRLSFSPTETLRCEIFHRGYWLASERDAWVRGLRIDPGGASGRFIGQETDLRLVWQARERLELDLACALFLPGDFVSATGSDPVASFVQLAATLVF